jgi:hypothetical protein
VPAVLKSGSLNLLEPSGPVQACNGIALLLPHGTCVFHTSVRTKGSNGLLLWIWHCGLKFRDVPLPFLGTVICVNKAVFIICHTKTVHLYMSHYLKQIDFITSLIHCASDYHTEML